MTTQLVVSDAGCVIELGAGRDGEEKVPVREEQDGCGVLFWFCGY